MAVYLVHSLGSSDFEDVDRVAAENVARAAAEAGVRQIVFLGGLGDDGAELSAHSAAATRRRARRLAVPVTLRPGWSARGAQRSRRSARSSTGFR